MKMLIGQQARVEIRYKNMGAARAISTHALPVEASVLSLQLAVEEALRKVPNNARIISYNVTVEQEA
jgi:hypothetical protein